MVSATKNTHALHNEVMLVWGSLRLAPIIILGIKSVDHPTIRFWEVTISHKQHYGGQTDAVYGPLHS